MESSETRESLARNSKLAEALGVRATPSFVIGSELISGMLDPSTFRALIANEKLQPQPGF